MANNSSKESNIVVGLDIGTSKIVCIVGQYDAQDSLEIIALGSSVLAAHFRLQKSMFSE